MIYVVGGRGFVGSAYARLFARLGIAHRIVTRANAAELAGTACDILINANGNSKKFLADRDPLGEFDASVRSVAETVERFKPGLLVHLSTGDVYRDQSSPEVTREDQPIDVAGVSRYGLHKLLAEQLVMATQERWLVFRMGGFVGPGLKKNAIFDMTRGDPLWLAPGSKLQFISTDHAAEIVWAIASSGVSNEVVNLGARGMVHIGDLHRRIGSRSPFNAQARQVTFELSLEKLKMLYGRELPHSEDEVMRYIAETGSVALVEGAA